MWRKSGNRVGPKQTGDEIYAETRTHTSYGNMAEHYMYVSVRPSPFPSRPHHFPCDLQCDVIQSRTCIKCLSMSAYKHYFPPNYCCYRYINCVHTIKDIVLYIRYSHTYVYNAIIIIIFFAAGALVVLTPSKRWPSLLNMQI